VVSSIFLKILSMNQVVYYNSRDDQQIESRFTMAIVTLVVCSFAWVLLKAKYSK
jgi:hypothetical protein